MEVEEEGGVGFAVCLLLILAQIDVKNNLVVGVWPLLGYVLTTCNLHLAEERIDGCWDYLQTESLET